MRRFSDRAGMVAILRTVPGGARHRKPRLTLPFRLARHRDIVLVGFLCAAHFDRHVSERLTPSLALDARHHAPVSVVAVAFAAQDIGNLEAAVALCTDAALLTNSRAKPAPTDKR